MPNIRCAFEGKSLHQYYKTKTSNKMKFTFTYQFIFLKPHFYALRAMYP
jgi:hypothetical protein